MSNDTNNNTGSNLGPAFNSNPTTAASGGSTSEDTASPAQNNNLNSSFATQPSNQSGQQISDSVLTPNNPGVFGESIGNMSAIPQQTNNTNGGILTSGIIGSPQVPAKYGGKKVVATIFGVVLLIAGVAAGVYLVNNQQELREKAATGAECSQSTDCILLDSPGNQGSFTAPRQIDHLFITAKDFHRYDPPGINDGCYNVAISGNSLNWNRVGDGPDCKDVSNIQVWLGGSIIESPTPTPTGTPTATLTPTRGVSVTITSSPTPTGIPSESPTPTKIEITASCSEVKVYSTSWVLLTPAELTSLDPGDVVRITVSGTASGGVFTKARFVINGVTTADTTSQKPGGEEFYHQYTIPNGVTNFSFNGEVFHSEKGWL